MSQIASMALEISMISERFSRQQDLIPIIKLEALTIDVIGVGSIGRNVALQLASIGAKRINLIDFDTVELHNCVTQGFLTSDIGLPKVDCVARSCKAIYDDMSVATINSKFKKSEPQGDVIFCCVDSISVRKFIFENLHENVMLFIDGRMSAEVMRIISIDTIRNKDYYLSTIFEQNDAYQERCTAKSTIYCANIAAGLMVSSFTKWLRNMHQDKDIVLNLLSNELTTDI